MQKFEWSPELWIRDSNLDQGSISGDGSLTFSDIVKIGKYLFNNLVCLKYRCSSPIYVCTYLIYKM